MATNRRRPAGLPYERRLEELEAIYASAQATLAARMDAALRAGDLFDARRWRAQLAAAVAVLDQLDAEILPQAATIAAQAYRDGAERAARQIAGLAVTMPEIPGAFSGVSIDAVAQFERAIVDRLDIAHRTIGRQVEDVYRREQLRASLRATLGANGSPRTAAADLASRLAQNRDVQALLREGGVGFVDRAGKRWQLDSYARMATRTVTREAAVQGSMARMVAHGIALARVSTHASACDQCKPMEGRLISLDGAVTTFDGEAVFSIGRVPPFHPNCAHSLLPFVPAIDELKRLMAAGRS